jgi:hypothetical protein
MKLTYARVTATLAATLVLASGATAALNVPARSVGATQLKRNAVTGRGLMRNAVTSPKVKASLRPTDLAPGAATQGPTGPAGPKGPTGDAATGAVDEIYYRRLSRTFGPGDYSFTTGCPTTHRLTGGGASVTGAETGEAWVLEAYPEGLSWRVIATNQSGTSQTITTTAICTRAPRG